MEKISGVVCRVIYTDEKTDWCVLEVEGEESPFQVTGITNAKPGNEITAHGAWKQKKIRDWKGALKSQWTFEAEKITSAMPVSEKGIERYLASGMIKGIGAGMAKRIVAALGAETLKILDENPEALRQVNGIGKKKLDGIIKGWGAARATANIMLFLNEHEISPALCRKIYKTYGEKSIEVIKENPYRLASEVRGIGFIKADEIGLQLAIPKTSPYRLTAGITHVLETASTDGHCGLPKRELLRQGAMSLGVHPDLIWQVAHETMQRKDGLPSPFVKRGELILLRDMADAEDLSAKLLVRIAEGACPWRIDLDEAIPKAEEEAGMKLAPKQLAAVKMALTSKVSVLTGGPGCGKTATLNVVLSILKKRGIKVSLAAPTGKAAQRAEEATGIPASTLHRLFGLKGGTQDDDQEKKLDFDILVIDECSMVDTMLLRSVLNAFPRKSALLIVGDTDQLPSVGAGFVLSDIIESGFVPVTKLDEVFRQAASSKIITNAHRINAGCMVEGHKSPEDDFFLLTEQNSKAIFEANNLPEDERPSAVARCVAGMIGDLVTNRLPQRYGFDPARDIQVLSPMNGGDAGVMALNAALQKSINPQPEDQRASKIRDIYVGDKVIQTKNNYDLGIFNGDMGFVLSVEKNEDATVVVVDFGRDRVVQIPEDDVSDLRLAYAMTIHKSQGSQAPAVVIPVITQHWQMLQRNLLYTGITRAQKLVVLVGVTRAIEKAVKTADAKKRHTRLRELIIAEDGARCF